MKKKISLMPESKPGFVRPRSDWVAFSIMQDIGGAEVVDVGASYPVSLGTRVQGIPDQIK